MSDGSGPGLGLEDGLVGLGIVGAQGDLGHVDVAVGPGDGAQVLAARALAGRRELGHRAARRGLGGLAAGVRVDLRVEHEDVDVATGAQRLVEAAEADVVGPAVTAHDPDAGAHEVAREREQRAGVGGLLAADAGERLAQPRPPARAGARCWPRCPAGCPGCSRASVLADDAGAACSSSAAGLRGLDVQRQAHAQAELGVVLEERVVPGRAAALGVDRPRAWWAGCRRRSTSSPWRWPRSCGRRRAG